MGKPRNSGKASSKSIKVLDRENEALKLRMVGLTFNEIGRRMGITGGRAHQLVTGAMESRINEYSETLDKVRRMELARLDHMWSTHFTKQHDNYNSAMICLKIMERRALYLGLDAPPETRVAHTVVNERPEYDLSSLSVSELRDLRATLEKAGAKQLPQLPPIEGEAIDVTPEEPKEESP